MVRTARHLRALPLLVALAALVAVSPARAACPPRAELLKAVSELPLGDATRLSVHDARPPEGLYREAAAEPGSVAVAREGKRGFAVAFVPLPVERLWKAVNDEPHHGGALVDTSEVIGGTPRGAERLLLQSMERLGVGRWWVDRVRMNRTLYEATGGRLWELVWEDAFDRVSTDEPAVARLEARLRRVEWTRGAWLLAPVGEGCTLIDYFVWTDPGGLASTFQFVGASTEIRRAVEGLVRLAREHVAEPHEGIRFLRPDGRALP